MKTRNVRIKQHVSYFRYLTFLDEAVVPESTLDRLYNGPAHPRLRFMVGGKRIPAPDLGVWTQEEIDNIQERARALAAELREMEEAD